LPLGLARSLWLVQRKTCMYQCHSKQDKPWELHAPCSPPFLVLISFCESSPRSMRCRGVNGGGGDASVVWLMATVGEFGPDLFVCQVGLGKDRGRCIQARVMIRQLALQARNKGIIASSSRFAQDTIYRTPKRRTMPYAFRGVSFPRGRSKKQRDSKERVGVQIVGESGARRGRGWQGC